MNKIEVNKKTKYLAYKSIPEDDIEESNDDNFIPGKKHNINNNEEDINIDINESEYIGRKRELTNKNDEQKIINKNISNKILYCFNCSWKFPDRMSLIRRNNHKPQFPYIIVK